ncbi:MAG: acyl--CoA ligase [Gemmatimonadetes bacterium]|nr:class I adenylate-forming enzyme family protein [Gemmatimonadota bacterium]MYA42997.1 acyl--CoA ligase [Gemmatimonadota bacterium]MYE93294.1 acyl--CoA ligase [Gemmatimonadota bacterium]MYJ10764.1 acyl--CoA ligase [Gemmatimonadota bacterium]
MSRRSVGEGSSPTVSEVLARRTAVAPGSPFLHFGDATWSYGEVEAQALSLAASLKNLGVGEGDRVALVLPAWPEFAVAVFAAAKLGARVVPLDPRLTLPDLRYMLRHSGAVCAVSAEDAYGIDYLQLFEDLLNELPGLRHLVTVGEEDLWYDDRIFQWEDLVSPGRGRDFAEPEVDPRTPFAIVYTFGTTGKPKGVELSHGNLLYAAAGTAAATGMNARDVVAGVGALHHAFGLGPGLLGTALEGASLILQDDRDPVETFALAERHGATIVNSVPSLFAAALGDVENPSRAPESLRLCIAAGAPVRESLARRVEESFGVPLIIAYSLTEAASTLAIGRHQEAAATRWFTVGRPLEGTTVRVTEDDGTPLPGESVGEIRVQGPGVMCGYHRQPQETAASFDEEGFLKTGDLGMLDDEGCLHVIGRREDVMIRGGFNVYPRELEDRLTAHPAIARAVVVGVSDEILGEAICACVIRVEGGVVSENEVREWSAATLSAYKVPDFVSFMDDFPRTASGGIWRQELARQVSSARTGPPKANAKPRLTAD